MWIFFQGQAGRGKDGEGESERETFNPRQGITTSQKEDRVTERKSRGRSFGSEKLFHTIHSRNWLLGNRSASIVNGMLDRVLLSC